MTKKKSKSKSKSNSAAQSQSGSSSGLLDDDVEQIQESLSSLKVDQSLPSPTVKSLTELWKSNYQSPNRLTGLQALFHSFPVDSVEYGINNSILNSKFASFYNLCQTAVTAELGSQAVLNWRWINPHHLLDRLIGAPVGTFDWYLHDNKMLPVSMNALSKMSSKERIRLLECSVIESNNVVMAENAHKNAQIAETVIQDFSMAAAKYSLGYNLDPHDLFLIYSFADFLAKRYENEGAEELLQQHLLLDPNNAKAWGLRALAAENAENIPAARLYYETAYRLDNTSITRLRNFAMFMIDVQDYERARQLYEERIVLDPSDAIVIGEYADLLHTLKLYDESLSAFERALSTGEVNNTVLNDYSILLHTVGIQRNDSSLLKKAKKISMKMINPSLIELASRAAMERFW